MKPIWQILIHLFTWLALLTFFVTITVNNTKITHLEMWVYFVVYPSINISLFYINFLVLVPNFLDKKKYGLFILSILVLVLLYGFGKYGVALIFKEVVLVRDKGIQIGFGTFFWGTIFTSFIFLFLSTVLKFTIDWFSNERIQRELENQRLTAELAFLKSQINPHFLFNSLNSIYSLAYQGSDDTPEAILKLSEIMRYMLYECNDNKVDLEKEFQYLHNFIDLQKIRFANKAFIDFTIEGKVEGQQIVPLLLIAFIENAFKHGVANNPETPILLQIKVEGAQLQFFIKNVKHSHNRDPEGGIGLNNVNRRLKQLYPNKFNLDRIDETDTYSVRLSLVL